MIRNYDSMREEQEGAKGGQRGQSLEIIIFYCKPKSFTLDYVKDISILECMPR
jgi:hypothetical protein